MKNTLEQKLYLAKREIGFNLAGGTGNYEARRGVNPNLSRKQRRVAELAGRHASRAQLYEHRTFNKLGH